jgi:hypothetical protein
VNGERGGSGGSVPDCSSQSRRSSVSRVAFLLSKIFLAHIRSISLFLIFVYMIHDERTARQRQGRHSAERAAEEGPSRELRAERPRTSYTLKDAGAGRALCAVLLCLCVLHRSPQYCATVRSSQSV